LFPAPFSLNTLKEESMKAFRNYRGVKIFRETEILPGSDFRVTEDGRILPAKPKTATWFKWIDGARCEDIAEVKTDIDDFIRECGSRSISELEAVTELNTPKEKVN